jgi:molecular chaperone IbpA
MSLANIPHFDPFSFATNLSKGSVGFDELFNKFSDTMKVAGYPPYNIKKTGDNTYVIEMAVAGFGRQDIELTLEDGVLSIKGEVKSDEKNDYLFKGIADRAFTRKFTLADTIEIKNADLLNGMLRIWLEKFIPEHKKIKKIDINTEETDTSKKSKTFLRD